MPCARSGSSRFGSNHRFRVWSCEFRVSGIRDISVIRGSKFRVSAKSVQSADALTSYFSHQMGEGERSGTCVTRPSNFLTKRSQIWVRRCTLPSKTFSMELGMIAGKQCELYSFELPPLSTSNPSTSGRTCSNSQIQPPSAWLNWSGTHPSLSFS